MFCIKKVTHTFFGFLFLSSLILFSCSQPTETPQTNSNPSTVPLVDGTVDSLYGTPYSTGSGETGFYKGDNQKLSELYATTDGSKLYLAVKMSPRGSYYNVQIFIDALAQTGGSGDLANDGFAAYGKLGIATNSIGATMEYNCSGWRNYDGKLTMGTERSVINALGSGNIIHDSAKTVTMAQTYDAVKTGNAVYEYAIPYSSIGSGVTAGDKIRIYVLLSNGNGKTASISQAQTQTIDYNNPLLTLDTAAPDLTLQ